MTFDLRVGGVPEHFNLPWHLAIEQGKFAEKNINLIWQDYPGGTGTMRKALRENTLDIAVLLTEGIVADIIQGNPSKIVQFFVKSPLIWGIHTSAQADFKNISELANKRVAISRLGSGSHLMAYVYSKQMNWQLSENQLVMVGDLAGGREALREKQADMFMWEKFMTKPLVDSGELKRLDECITPWACFAIAVREDILQRYPEKIKDLLAIINQSAQEFQQNTNSVDLVVQKFQLKPEDAQNWFSLTKWATNQQVMKSDLEMVMQTLVELDFISEKISLESICEMSLMELV